MVNDEYCFKRVAFGKFSIWRITPGFSALTCEGLRGGKNLPKAHKMQNVAFGKFFIWCITPASVL
jgi:hypothetical protein